MGAMKNLKLAQMELMEEHADNIASACRLKNKGECLSTVLYLLGECGFARKVQRYLLSDEDIFDIRRHFEKIAKDHDSGMRSGWKDGSFHNLTHDVELAEWALTDLGFHTDMEMLSRKAT